jgi:hypothetical protein
MPERQFQSSLRDWGLSLPFAVPAMNRWAILVHPYGMEAIAPTQEIGDRQISLTPACSPRHSSSYFGRT